MRALLDLVLPSECAGCGVPGAAACSLCARALAAPARQAWPSPSPPGLPPPYAVARYDGATRDLLLAYKEHGAVALRPLLGDALARAVVAAAGDIDGSFFVVPVPSSRAARRRRGDDVVRALARRAATVARRAGVRVATVDALRHVRAVADSAGLGAEARAVNLAGAFGLRRGATGLLAGNVVVLADDLITTGATLAACTATLRAAGATVVGAATVAATSRRSESGRRAAQLLPAALRSG